MAIIKRLFLRSGLITLILLQLGCVFVLYHHATSSSSSLTSGGGSSGVGISGLTGLINLKSLKLFLSDPALQKINVSSPEIYPLKDQDASDYFSSIGDTKCFTAGINLLKSYSSGKCSCKSEVYYGLDCGIPKEIFLSPNLNLKRVRRREQPRRIIQALPVNHEFDLFEVRVNSLYDAVDVFLVGESNYTNAGGGKEPMFLQKFQQGWLKNFQDKIVYVFSDQFPADGLSRGELAVGHMRHHLSHQGLKQLNDVRLDDLFVYTDADEIPKPEILLFLKLYDGFSQPVAFNYKWAVFGFFWQVDPKVFGSYKSPEPSAVTVKFLRDFYDYDASFIRTDKYLAPTKQHFREMYDAEGEHVGLWSVFDAGWHCSWCFSPEGISKKLLDAPHSDRPRYGDFPKKTEATYIKRLIKNGIYFDLNEFRNGPEVNERTDPEFAPPFVLNNPGAYQYLLKNPYKDLPIA